MQFKTKITEIPGKGKGRIVEELVKKGQIVFNGEKEEQIIFYQESQLRDWAKSKSQEELVDLSWFAFGQNGQVHMYVNHCYFNHSFQPNIVLNGFKCIALCDINPGEEILIDYSSSFEKIDWFDKFCSEKGLMSAIQFADYYKLHIDEFKQN